MHISPVYEIGRRARNRMANSAFLSPTQKTAGSIDWPRRISGRFVQDDDTFSKRDGSHLNAVEMLD
jgi:hypothetical protein